MHTKRVTVFAGHYGSGKTNIALNYAFELKKQQETVTLCDLDIVNPYFRTADFKKDLEQEGIRLITSPFANTNVEFVSLPAETQSILDDKTQHAVVDLGGDERGALALGRYAKRLKEDDYEMFLVINPFRPLTATQKELQEVVREIEEAARVPFTGIVNNANLGAHTTLSDVADSVPFAQQAAKELGLPLRMTVVTQELLATGKAMGQEIEQWGDVFPIKLFHKPNWVI